MKKILLVHNDYGAFSGEEHMVSSIYNLLQKEGLNVKLYRVDGIKNDFKGKFLAAYYSLFGDRKVSKELNRLIEQFEPDTVLLQNVFPRIGASFINFCKSKNIKTVMRLANYRLACPVGTAMRNNKLCFDCERKTSLSAIKNDCARSTFKSVIYSFRHILTKNKLRTLDKYIAQTQFQKAQMSEFIGKDKIAIINNFYEHKGTAESNKNDKKSKWSTNRFQQQDLELCFASRRSVDKGFDTYLSMAKKYPDIKFHVMGRLSDEFPEPVEMKNVIDHGFLSEDKLINILARCHFLIIPSKWPEGFPNIVLQALSSECLPVVSNLGGLPEAVKFGDNGIIVDGFSLDSFCRFLESLDYGSDQYKTMVHKGLDNLSKDFSSSQYSKNILKVLL